MVEVELSSAASTSEARPDPPGAERDHFERYAVGSSTGALALASLEAICLAVIAVGRVGVALGFTSTLAAAGASFWHRDPIRIPILVFSFLAAMANLFAVARKLRLRNAPSAAWRKKPLLAAERRRIWIVVCSSGLTIALVAGEVFAHRMLGH